MDSNANNQENNLPACPKFDPGVSMDFGGTVTGGTVIDSSRIYAQAAPNRLSTVGSAPFDERGAVDGLYFFTIENIDGATALFDFSATWEDKPCP